VGGQGGRLGVVDGVSGVMVPSPGVGEGLVQAVVELADGAGVQPAGLAVLAALVGQVVVQALDLQGRQGAERERAEIWADVMLQQLAVAAERPQPDRALGLQVGQPLVQQLVDRGRGMGRGRPARHGTCSACGA
jgi:hypothetical protein